MPVSAAEIIASKAAIEENKKRSEERAALAASQGNSAREQTWLASAARYQNLLDIKDRLAASAARQEQAREDAEARRQAAIEAARRAEEERQRQLEEARKRAATDGTVEPPFRGGYTAPPISPTPLTPSLISNPIVSTPPPPPVKTAPIDTVLFNDEEVPIEVMTDLIFEDIGGQELINIARNDIINGQQVSYQPIKNLSSIQQQYNPNNILSLQATSDKYFANFPIKLENKIPTPGTGPSGTHVYIDAANGNLIIEAVNIEPDEQIEIEITVSGTIYEAEFGEIIS
jgi:hypothetical protein